MHNFVAQRITASDPVAYAVKWVSHTAYVVSVLQGVKYLSSESVAFSSHKQENLKANLDFVVTTQ